MADDIRRIRTIGLLAEGGAGKTTLAEALLYAAGATTRQGRVDDGNSVFDFEPEEIRRKVSLSTAPHSITWQRTDIRLLDPPGMANFLSDTRYAMEAMTGAVFVAGPTGQLKVESERMWGWANLLQLPRLVCLSRMDREEGSLDTALSGLRDTLEGQFVPVQIPVGSQADFRGVVDLLTMKALMFSGDNGAVEEHDIPDEIQAEADARREQLVEAIAELDDDLLNRYLEGEDIPIDEFKAGLSKAVAAAQLFPVLCVSGGQCAGVQPLLDAMVAYLPSPDQGPVVTGKHPKSQEDEERMPDPAAPFSARVFKTIDSPTGRLSLMRVCSGTLASDSVVYNSSRDARERLGQLFSLDGKKTTARGVGLTR
jgi:elongation factor G